MRIIHHKPLIEYGVTIDDQSKAVFVADTKITHEYPDVAIKAWMWMGLDRPIDENPCGRVIAYYAALDCLGKCYVDVEIHDNTPAYDTLIGHVVPIGEVLESELTAQSHVIKRYRWLGVGLIPEGVAWTPTTHDSLKKLLP